MALKERGEGVTATEWLRSIGKYAFIHVFLFFLFLLEVLPLNVLSLNIDIYFFVMGLFFWSFHRPNVLPITVVFIYGLISDVLILDSIGLFTILYTVFAVFLRSQRRRLLGQSFPMLWMFFVLMLLTMAIASNFYSIVMLDHSLNYMKAGLKILFTGLVFPFVNMLLFYQHRSVSKF